MGEGVLDTRAGQDSPRKGHGLELCLRLSKTHDSDDCPDSLELVVVEYCELQSWVDMP